MAQAGCVAEVFSAVGTSAFPDLGFTQLQTCDRRVGAAVVRVANSR